MADKFKYAKPKPGAGSGRVYEDDIRKNYGYALDEGGRHFQRKSEVHRAMVKIALKLEELRVPYAVVGGMALLEHGYARFTEDVDLLVNRDGINIIHDQLEGKGYRPPFPGSKNLRDTELGVRVEFIIAGEFPGDGRPKPVAFPDPLDVQDVRKGIRFISTKALVELKLASGLSNSDRLKDISDVQELIKATGMGVDFAEQLSPYVRDKYLEICPKQTKYMREWPVGSDVELSREGIEQLRRKDASLDTILRNGIQIDRTSGVVDGSIILFTYSVESAHEYELHPSDEFRKRTIVKTEPND